MPILANAKHERFAQARERGAFYVYRLVDPRTAATFYVGKGSGNRALIHAANERTGREKNFAKAIVLGELRRAGLAPTVVYVRRDLSESAAYRLERRLILAQRSTLSNISPGQLTEIDRSKLQATALLAEIKPLDQWSVGRTAEEVALGHAVIAELANIARHGFERTFTLRRGA